ncbi:MAG: WXG100 family type VII secretion target [Christensenellales bacterium]|jgi:WXG100 family type VII secretion target
MSGYTVDYRQLMDAAHKIQTEAEVYDKTAETLKAAADQLANCWEGPASRNFRNEQERAYAWFKEMAVICRDYAEKANIAAVRYHDAEEAAKAAINKS